MELDVRRRRPVRIAATLGAVGVTLGAVGVVFAVTSNSPLVPSVLLVVAGACVLAGVVVAG